MSTYKTATPIDRNYRDGLTYYAWTSIAFGWIAVLWMLCLTIFGYLCGQILLMTISAHGLSAFLIALCFFHHKQYLTFFQRINDNLPEVAKEMEQEQA